MNQPLEFKRFLACSRGIARSTSSAQNITCWAEAVMLMFLAHPARAAGLGSEIVTLYGTMWSTELLVLISLRIPKTLLNPHISTVFRPSLGPQ